jgi:glycosyltransferase involved in cell wall biosynthesis
MRLSLPAKERPLHVAHVAEALGGGLLEVVRITAEGNCQAGMQVVLLHGRRPETPDGSLSELLPTQVDVVEIPGWGTRRPSAELRAARTLKRELASREVDVVVFHSSFAAVTGAFSRAKCTTIFTPHAFASRMPSGLLRHLVFSVGERYACRFHDIIACVSHSEARAAKSLGAKTVVTIPNGIPDLSNPQWSPDPQPPRDPKVVAIGRLVPQRRPIETAAVLKAVSDVAQVEWVGGGGEPPYAHRAAQALHAAGVRPTGWLTHQAVAERMRTASIYLHWTQWDGLPMTVLEAMANDVVVVASDTEPNREVLGTHGVCTTEDSAIAMIRTLLTDPEAWRTRIFDQRDRAAAYGAATSQERWNHLLETTVSLS